MADACPTCGGYGVVVVMVPHTECCGQAVWECCGNGVDSEHEEQVPCPTCEDTIRSSIHKGDATSHHSGGE